MLRVRDESWDFRGETAKVGIHGIHTYPAMMLPQIAKRLIEKYGRDKKAILDPFCGSGTVLVEGLLNGKDVFGYDINPLAVLISKVKVTPIDVKELVSEVESIEDELFPAQFDPKVIESVETPKFFNIEYWFKPSVIKQLAFIKSVIDEIENETIRDFVLVAFSETVRKVSNTRDGEYKLFRIPESKLKRWNPNAIGVFLEILNRNLRLAIEHYPKIPKDALAEVFLEDVRKGIDVSADMVLTSPPYGDSRTTVAYGQFSRLSLQWLGYDYEKIKNIDKISLGGVRAKRILSDVSSPTLYEVLDNIRCKDEKRALDVYSFFKDFQVASERIASALSDDSVVILVVGNRTVCKINIPTDLIMSEIFQSFGFKTIEILIREIPSKRLPKRSSPSNVKGDSVSTMNYESIVVLKR